MNPNYPQGGAIPVPNPSYPMARLNGSAYAAPLNYNQPSEVVGGYDAKINPMTGEEIPDVNFAKGGEVGLASLLASRGRGGDSVLVHMTPGEVQGLQGLALAHGGSLTVNPHTGLPEANFLKNLLPSIAGFTLNSLFPGLGTVGTSLVVAGVSGLAEGSFSKGLKAGLGAYSGASIREALSKVAAEKAAAEGLAKLGKESTQAAAKEGVKEAVGLTKEAVELPAQAVKGLQIPAMKLGQPGPISMPGLSSDSIRALSSAIGESAAAARPTLGQLGQGLRSLTQRGGLESFVGALGGPQKAGFVFSPITQAIEEAELEEQQRAMRRAQEGESAFPYYIPGQFDFATGKFAPGVYQTRTGQPYTPAKPFGFADGGIVDLVGIDPRSMPGRGDPGITYPPSAPQPIVPPAQQAFAFPQQRDVRRDITDQYIADLNARLARGVPQYEAPVAPPVISPPVNPPVTPPIDIPIVPPGFLPPGFIVPRDQEPLPQPPPSSIEPVIPDYYPVEPRAPYIQFPNLIPVEDKEKKPTTEIEALPENIAPDYEGVPVTPVQNFDMPFIPEPPDKRGVISYEEVLGLPEGFMIPPEPDIPRDTDISWLRDIGIDPGVSRAIDEAAKDYSVAVEPLPVPAPEPFSFRDPGTPVQIDTSALKDIGIDPNIEKNLKAQMEAEKDAAKKEAEEKSLGQKALDVLESSGGGLGALIGAGRELFGPGETNLRDFLEAAARGYLPDMIEKPAEEFASKFGIKTEQLSPEEAAKADAEALARKEAEAKAEKEKTQVEPEQEVVAPVPVAEGGGGGGGGDLGVDYGGPSNYYNNSLQNFLDQFYMDQMMGGDNRTYSVGVETLAGGGAVNHYAKGGLGMLREYRAGGKYLRGPGDGMSDGIRANIEGRQEARLADGEFVIPADVVSHLGNGSSNAGAKKLHQMMARVRKARTGRKKQAPAVKVDRYLPG